MWDKKVRVITTDFTNGWIGTTDGTIESLGNDKIIWVDFEHYDLSPLPFKVEQVDFQ